MQHWCGSCGELYRCPRDQSGCGSPYMYDCHRCYLKRYWRELESALQQVEERFGLDNGSTGISEFCDAH